MQHFYDGQIRRYITQMVRLMSNFSYKDGKGNLTVIPVMYGDLTRQVANIIRENSENKIPSAPRMAVYITGLAMDTNRLADSSYINKVNIREQAYDSDGKEYLNKEGKNYTVERMMPTPYTLTVNVDIWSTNTDQKLQILEQILMLFNPSLEIQTTDNYIDWTSLSVVNLENLTFSSRSVPVGVDSEIDVATMTFNTPIYISPPVKVKRLGVITQVIQSIFNESAGTIELDLSRPITSAFDDTPVPKSASVTTLGVSNTGTPGGGTVTETITSKEITKSGADLSISTAHDNYGILVMGGTAKLLKKGIVGAETWTGYIKSLPFNFDAGVTNIHLRRDGVSNEIVGTVTINPMDEYELTINWDNDTLPPDTIMHGPNGDRNKIDYIINPLKTSPTDIKSGNPRILLLESIGDTSNVDGADDWKNSDNTDLVASANDIIEWDGSKWHIVFDASTDDSTVVYTSNLNTAKQYKFVNDAWILSYDGEYPVGTWYLNY